MADLSRTDGGLRELALFAGAGGGILGGKLLGWTTVCAVECEPYAASVLIARQNDGLLPPFPIWDDVCTFDGRPWCGVADVVSGGFPCQDISVAGGGAGIGGERSGLWAEMARIIGEVRPRYVFVENSPALTVRGLGRVLGDLAALGFDARWGVLGAFHAGAPHKRERIWVVANATGQRERSRTQCGCHAGRCEQLEVARSGGNFDHGSQAHDVSNSDKGGRVRRAGNVGAAGRHEFTDGGCLADTSGHGRKQGRAKPEGRQGGFETCQCSSLVPDANSQQHESGSHARSGQGEGARTEVIPADAHCERCQKQHAAAVADQTRQHPWGTAEIGRDGWWATEPDVG